MVTKQDYYTTLEVDRGASKAEIKKAYLRLARKHHPDVNKEPGAEARFKEITEAYEVLSDDDRRASYDRFGHAGVGGGMGGGPFGGSPFGGAPFGGGSAFEDLFESFFGGMRQQGPPRGADLQTSITIDFEESIFGAERELTVTRLQTCKTCNGNRSEPGTRPVTCLNCAGTGQVRRVQNTILGQFMTTGPCERCRGEGVIITNPCKTCRGEGRVRQTSQLTVSVPAGIEDNATLRLTGQGEAAPGGGPPGHLYVRVRVRPHKQFVRQGRQILLEQPLHLVQAVLGDEFKVPTVDGPVTLKVPAGTQSGQTFRLRGHGAPDVRGGDRGDQIVTVRVQVPTQLSEEQRELFTQLAGTFGYNPRQQGPGRHDRGFFDRLKGAFIGPDED